MSTFNVRSHVNGLHVPLLPGTEKKLTGLYSTKSGNDLIFDKKSLGRIKLAKKSVMKIADESVNVAELA